MLFNKYILFHFLLEEDKKKKSQGDLNIKSF